MLRRTLLSLTAATVLAAPAFAGGHSKDIVDTAVEAGSFNTLVAAVQAAGLVDTLKGEGPFTVFAPTDDAFAKLPEGTVEGLLNDIPTLTKILTYHVVPGKVMSGRSERRHDWPPPSRVRTSPSAPWTASRSTTRLSPPPTSKPRTA